MRRAKRVWIDKPDGGRRPLGITCVEDKIVQQALVRVLESIYEVDFPGIGCGFRPERSQHRALGAPYMALMVKNASFVFDAGIQGYYGPIDRSWLMRFLEHRIADRRILTLIEQTVQAGAHASRGGNGYPRRCGAPAAVPLLRLPGGGVVSGPRNLSALLSTGNLTP